MRAVNSAMVCANTGDQTPHVVWSQRSLITGQAVSFSPTFFVVGIVEFLSAAQCALSYRDPNAVFIYYISSARICVTVAWLGFED